jgi:hypothetical protein
MSPCPGMVLNLSMAPERPHPAYPQFGDDAHA